MGIIHVLDTEVSNKIAAGEVVERPLSVVKELIENSIDAGADRITVEILEGGTSYIRVNDNGTGMSAEDAEACFLRHATSKIQTDEDLDAIYTLGFRGEALSSIGAVSRVKLYTKRRCDAQGICVTCRGGQIVSAADTGTPDGTTIEVSDLFYNTPARRKFLKKTSTEAGYIVDIVSRYAFAYPNICFKLIRDGKESVFAPGNGSMMDAIYAVYGKNYAKNMLPVDYEYNDIHITGVVGKGEISRPNRSYQTFFVNKRYIKSGLMIKALEEAYKNQIMSSKFPVAILNIELPADKIDINVHPTKLECKFSDEQMIYQAVYHSVKSALYSRPNVPAIERKPAVSSEEQHEMYKNEEGYQRYLEDVFYKKVRSSNVIEETNKSTVTAESLPRPALVMEEISGYQPHKTEKLPQKPEEPVGTEKLPQKSEEPVKTEQKKIIEPIQDNFMLLDFALEDTRNKNDDIGVNSSSEDGKAESKHHETWREYVMRRINEQQSSEDDKEDLFKEGYFRVIGQLFDTYILLEKDDNLLMIDQHAAHERLNYEALKKELEMQGVSSQMILEPIDVSLTAPEIEVFKENKKVFDELGFGCVEVDDDHIQITAIPTDVSWSDGENLFIELLTQISEMHNDIIAEKKERLLYTISCKAAIKANMKISEIEMHQLAERVFKLKNINTCPHGRPIVISMSKQEIEKDFKRIV